MCDGNRNKAREHRRKQTAPAPDCESSRIIHAAKEQVASIIEARMILPYGFVNQCLLAVVRLSTRAYQAFSESSDEIVLLSRAFAEYLSCNAYGLCNQVVDERLAFRSGWHDVSSG